MLIYFWIDWFDPLAVQWILKSLLQHHSSKTSILQCSALFIIQLSHLYTSMGFPHSSSGKESTCNAGDLGSIPGLGRPPGEGKGYPLQYSGLENSRNYTVHGVAKSRTRLSDFHFHICTWLQEKPGEENGNPLQYSCLENPMDRGAWQAIVRGGSRIRHELATKLPPPPQEKP